MNLSLILQRGRRALFLAIVVLSVFQASNAADPLRVMSFNIWVGGESSGQPLSQTAAVIRAAKADIAGLQETRGEEKNGVRPDNGKKVAEILGWNYLDQGGGTGVLTRHPILTNTPQKWGVLIRVPEIGEVWMFNAHLNHAPYQPYQLLKIPYANAPFITTAEEAVAEARKARGEQVSRLVSEMKVALASGKPVFLTGDFNEPSHQDWTKRAADAGKVPIAVPYPTTVTITETGVTDAYRTVFPNEVEHRGNTWTPLTRPDDPKDRHDRIDLIFFTGKNMKPIKCEVVGEAKEFADIVVQPYPSDHRAVVATMEMR
ncbi:MAG TPA: endonuclease/exonuclease/phosphatase family protein [Candidatus Kapabacteria bacterium]|nr:endonuclease/exonuclease/phosphatase family protein [Candidatus Kapabacteria bacterium]